MSILTPLRHRIQAALTPQQMSRQLSRPEGSWMDKMYGGSYKANPDDRTYIEYDEMYRTDPQIRGATNLITQLLLSRQLIVTPMDDTPEAQEQADFIEEMFQDMDYPLRQVRTDIYTAIQYGYSVGEIVYKPPSDEQGMVTVRKIRPLHIETIQDCFKMNDEGDVEEIIQTSSDDGEIEIPREKCLVYTHGERFGNPYGTSLYQSVYDNWYAKRKIIKWWNVFLQKHEGPTLVGKVANPAYKDLMRNQLEEVREGRTQITVGMEDEVSILESAHRGEGFQNAITYHDTMILHGMNIGPLLIGQEQSTGSYNQSSTQENITFIYLDGLHEDIASEFEKLVKQLCELNYPNALPPIVSFEPFEDQDLLGLINSLKPLIDNFTINPGEEWVKELISKVVSKYSDVSVPVKEEDSNVGVVVPTQQEKQEPLPEEHTQLIEQVAQTLPGQEPTE